MSYLCKNCGERFDMPIMLTSYPPKDGCPKCISTKIASVGDIPQTKPNIEDIPLDRLIEICQAEREGRCVVLPCSVETTVWVSPNNGKSFHTAKIFGTNRKGSYLVFVNDDVDEFDSNIVKNPLRKCFYDWFSRVYTREEAEKALKERVENG